MNRSFVDSRWVFVSAIVVCLCVLASLIGARAGSPEIYRIERFLTNQVLLHFDTEPNRAYILQYSDSLTLTSTGVVGRWSNLFTVPALPFPNHYVIVDTGTASQRFYRLSATP